MWVKTGPSSSEKRASRDRRAFGAAFGAGAAGVVGVAHRRASGAPFGAAAAGVVGVAPPANRRAFRSKIEYHRLLVGGVAEELRNVMLAACIVFLTAPGFWRHQGVAGSAGTSNTRSG